MRNTFIVLCMLLSSVVTYSQQVITLSSSVDQVTVYRSGALVSRAASSNLAPGQYVLRFSGLSPLLDVNSIQILADAGIRMLSVTHQLADLESDRPEELILLFDKKALLTDSVNMARAELSVLKEEVLLLSENRMVSDKATNHLSALKALSEYYRSRLSEIKRSELEIQKTVKRLEEKLKQVDKEIETFYRQVKGRKTSTVDILADVSVQKNFDIGLNYLVTNAGWSTSYDIHVQDISQPLNITSKGNISNRSQEIWTEAQLTLSTGNPRRHSHLPVLQPWWLRFDNPVIYRKANVQDLSNTRAMEEMEMDGVTVESYLATTEENLTTLEYRLPKRMTISANGQPHTVVLDQQEVAALYTYRCVPKLDLAAYLSARIPDWEALNLSSGQANLFLENNFVGRTYLDPGSVADTLDLSLGVDIGVVVTREQTRAMEEAAALSTRRTRHIAHKITIKNNKSQDIDILVFDQYPLSTDDDIEVVSGKAPGAAVDKEKGIIQWDLQVAGGGVRELTFDYSVRYPKKKNLRLP